MVGFGDMVGIGGLETWGHIGDMVGMGRTWWGLGVWGHGGDVVGVRGLGDIKRKWGQVTHLGQEAWESQGHGDTLGTQGHSSDIAVPAVDDVQVSCYRILCSIYSLGTARGPLVDRWGPQKPPNHDLG